MGGNTRRAGHRPAEHTQEYLQPHAWTNRSMLVVLCEALETGNISGGSSCIMHLLPVPPHPHAWRACDNIANLPSETQPTHSSTQRRPLTFSSTVSGQFNCLAGEGRPVGKGRAHFCRPLNGGIFGYLYVLWSSACVVACFLWRGRRCRPAGL